MNSYVNHSMKRHVNIRCSNYFKLNPSGDAFEIFGISLISSVAKPGKLVQLERLHSEDSPHCPMITLTIEQFIFNLKSKQHKVNVKNLKNLPKLQVYDFWKKPLYATHTLWNCLIRCVNMTWIRRVVYTIQSGHVSVHRRTDGQTDKVEPVYPL